MSILPELQSIIWDFAIPGGLFALDRIGSEANEFGQDGNVLEVRVMHDPIVVQPLKGSERMQLAEGDRQRESIEIHTCKPLFVSKGGSNRLSSVLLYDPLGDGEMGRYIVKVAEPWLRQAGMWRCQAVLEETDR